MNRRIALPIISGAILVGVAAAPSLAPHGLQSSIVIPFAPPRGGSAFLGGDVLGRDVWSRVLAGGWNLILTAGLISLVVTVLSAVLGAIAALRPVVGAAIERLADTLMLVPPVLVILIVLLSWPDSGLFGLVLISVLAGVPYCARVFTAACAGVARSGYVQVAAASGERLTYLVFREVLPNLRSTLLTQAGLRFVAALYLVSTAAFLQVTSTLGQSNWAVMVRENQAGLSLNAWAVLAPSLAMGLVAVLINLAVTSLADEKEITHERR